MSKAANGRSSIHRHADGQGWEGWVSVGAHPVTGKRWRKHVRGATKTAVADKIEKLERQRNGGVVPIGTGTTLAQWLDLWLAGRAAAGLRPNSISAYRTDVKHVIRSGMGAVRLHELRPEHIERVYVAVLGSRCSAGSVAHVKRTLNAALNVAVARGHLARNPVALAATPRHEPPEVEPYTVDEICRILSTARKRGDGVRWSLALLGLRQGEVLGLRWEDLDLEACELTVRHSLSWLPWQHGCLDVGGQPTCGRRAASCPGRHSGGAYLGRPKSAAGRRALTIPRPVLSELHEHRKRQAAARLAAGSMWHDYGYVVTNALGGPLHRSSDRANWLELVAAASVRRLRIHDLRHSAATALLVLGEDSRTLLGVMGWTSMTLVQRYTHIVPDLRRNVANRQTVLWASAQRD